MSPQRAGDEIRDALVRQWYVIATALHSRDLDAASRVVGWRNREVAAHLCLQPILLRRFLATASTNEAAVSLAANLAGTHALADVIDAAAREGAAAERIDFARSVDDALPPLCAADLTATVVTVQGSIRIMDYLVTRCIEAVVHGRDLVSPVAPDPVAEAITADALLHVLGERAPHLVSEAQALATPAWIDVATGRRPCSGALASAVPAMT